MLSAMHNLFVSLNDHWWHPAHVLSVQAAMGISASYPPRPAAIIRGHLKRLRALRSRELLFRRGSFLQLLRRRHLHQPPPNMTPALRVRPDRHPKEFGANSSALCVPCPQGQSADPGLQSCSNCPTSTFADNSTGTATSCPAGTAINFPKASLCTQCNAGQFAPAGSAQCIDCQHGYCSDSTGAACAPRPRLERTTQTQAKPR